VVSSTMLNESMEALFELDSELANDVIEMENEANNIFWLIRRLLLFSMESQDLADKMGLSDAPDPTDLRVVSKSLETIADCSVGIAKIALDLHRITHDGRIIEDLDKRELEEIPSLDQLVKELLRQSLESYFSRDLLMANNAINLRRKFDAKIETFMRTAKVPYFPAIAIMLGIIAENCSGVASVAFDLQIKKSSSFPQSDETKP